ncbi:hypothetical protein CLF_109985 [Clonorchis sinensis]|uniref:Pol-related protein n=1 Tax=Clonorchis sinensis TaxID=79923 RepID=G7YT27_CLOSI|nr:hypothetical protein CLF_109985 [Clonorchis sinensis]
MSFSLHLEKSAQKAFAVLRMIRRTFSRITRTDFQILYEVYVRPLLEYANPVVYSGRTKDVILIERVQRAATKVVAGLKSVDYETRLAVLDLFPWSIVAESTKQGRFEMYERTGVLHGCFGDTTYIDQKGGQILSKSYLCAIRQKAHIENHNVKQNVEFTNGLF